MKLLMMVLLPLVVFFAGCSSKSGQKQGTSTASIDATLTMQAGTTPAATRDGLTGNPVLDATLIAAGTAPPLAGTPSAGGTNGIGGPPASAVAQETAEPGTGAGSPVPVNTPRAYRSPPTSGGFWLDTPAVVTGTIDVALSIKDPPVAYRGFNVQLTYDPKVLTVSSVSQGDVLGGRDQVFCVPQINNEAGTALFGCTILGPNTTNTSGQAAIFHLQAIAPGTTTLHFTTFVEGGSSTGSYLIDSNSAPVPFDGQDVTVGVQP